MCPTYAISTIRGQFHTYGPCQSLFGMAMTKILNDTFLQDATHHDTLTDLPQEIETPSHSKERTQTWIAFFLTLFASSKAAFNSFIIDLFGAGGGHAHRVPHRKPRLYPSGLHESDDRILNQLNYSLPLDTTDKSLSAKLLNAKSNQLLTGRSEIEAVENGLKLILVYTGLGETEKGQQYFLDNKCAIDSCFLTDSVSYGTKAHAVLFQNQLAFPHFSRPQNQIWIMYLLESPFNTQHLTRFNKHINWTATYRTDSTIVTPYEKWVTFSNATQYYNR